MTSWLALLAAVGSCGPSTSNVDGCQSQLKIHPCSSPTALEDAQNALDADNYSLAITDLLQVIASDPAGDYEHYPMLAGAYAARAGLDPTTLAQQLVSGGGSGSNGNAMGQITSLVPNPATTGAIPFSNRISDMNSACSEVNAITAAWLANPTGGVDATSVALQKTLYNAAYAAFVVNQVVGGESG